jgi:hypothetical protein
MQESRLLADRELDKKFQSRPSSQYWLQTNRIDDPWQDPTLVGMRQIEPKVSESPAPILCQRCGGLMRLIGSEPHPVEAKTDLLTYACTGCEDFLVLPVAMPASML